ncbi:MAG: repeat containing protein [Cyanobacteria bacterium RYN_339]|nr:repeat containing protein [Cyanobacteria bacterium RYN_339]
MPSRVSTAIALALVGLLVGCQSPASKPTVADPKASTKPKPAASTPNIPSVLDPSKPATTVISRDGAGVISRDGAGVISRDGAGVISRDGAGISGVARLPAGVISRDGAGVISRDGAGVISRDGAGYRVAALAEDVPLRKQLVYLLDAKGRLVLGADDQPITAETDEQGRFAFKGFVTTHNLLLAIQLYDDKGLVQLVLPRGDAPSRTVELGLASTLTATYIQEQFVKPQADPVATFERLPAELEASTRASVVTAAAAAPTDLTPPAVVAAVDGLRKQAKAVDDQFAEVRRVLLAGQSNQGLGLPADKQEMDAVAVAVGPGGQLVFASEDAQRVFRKALDGTLQAVAGTGLKLAGTVSPSGPAPGDGGPATAAALIPKALAYGKDGALLIADDGTQRIRQVAADGTITTRAASPDWHELRGVVEEPDGGLLVATHSALFRVPPKGQPTLLAGDVRPFDARSWIYAVPGGDGGAPKDARFRGILALARDPRTGDVLVYDAGGEIRRITATRVEAVAGNGLPGDLGDNGPALQAQISLLGSLAVRPDGSILLGDPTAHRIRQIANGTISTFAGNGTGILSGDGGPQLAAGLPEPAGLAPQPDGSLVFIDRGYVRWLGGGVVQTLVGGTSGFTTPRPATAVQLLGPRGLTYDAAAHAMWVEDDRHVWRWDLAANTLVSIFGGGAGGTPFAEGQAGGETNLTIPRSLVPLAPDRFALLGTDPSSLLGRVLLMEGGKLKTLAGGAAQPETIVADGPALGAYVSASDSELVEADGAYFYSFAAGGAIFRFQPGGNAVLWAGGGKQTEEGNVAKDMHFARLTAMAKGPDGRLYVATPLYIYSIDLKTMQVIRVAGSAAGTDANGGDAQLAKLDSPSAFAWDAKGILYFAEPGSSRIRRVRPGSPRVMELVAGAGTQVLTGTTIDTALGAPGGLAFDKNGDLYVADTRYGQIKVVRKAQLAP